MTAGTSTQPLVLPRPEHPISRKNIDVNALKVLNRLHRAGHRAYLVGGAVRDLLLGRKPKDYDVSTDARPPQVRRLFRNSRIIGRRFRLAHIYFREGIVEVATFRKDPDPEAQRGGPGELLITDDNVFGTPEQDAFRRDFTVNALFYNIADFSVIDYVGGAADLQARTLRVIGEPEVRFQEDPVRMTRACELAGRLEFTIERLTQQGIRRSRREILKASPARMTEELLDLLRSGSSGPSLQWMVELGLAELLLPEVEAMLECARRGLGHYGLALPVLDGEVRAGRVPSEIGLLSALLLPAVELARAEREHGGRKALKGEALRLLALETVEPFFQRFTLSRAKAERVAQTVMGLERMRRSRWTRPDRVRFAQRPYFEDALLLYEVVAAATDGGGDDLAVWRRVAESRPSRAPRPRRPARRGRRRRRRRPYRARR